MDTQTPVEEPTFDVPAVPPIRLRDGTEFVPQPMDVKGFILFKNVLVRLARGTLKRNNWKLTTLMGEGGDPADTEGRGVQLIMNLLEDANENDLLDLLQAFTGYPDRAKLAANFQPGLLVAVIRSGLSLNGLELADLLGEARASLGSGT